MSIRLLPWSVAVLLAVAPARVPSPTPLDVRTASYREDDAVARPVAALRATLWPRGDAVVLSLEVAAVGPDVDPLPGVDGAPGANLRTAEELHFLLADDALRLETRADGAGAVPQVGRLERVERGHLPVRRLLPDGSLDLAAVAPAALPLRATFCSAPLPEGRSCTWLVAGAAPRLAIVCERRGATARVLAIDSLAEPRPVVGGRR